MRQIATICKEPKEAKPCLFARHDRSEGPVPGTLFLEDLDAAKAVFSYAPWHPAGDDPKDALLWALS